MAAVFVPRSPTTGVLYGVVRTHLTELLTAVDAQTDGVVSPVRRQRIPEIPPLRGVGP